MTRRQKAIADPVAVVGYVRTTPDDTAHGGLGFAAQSLIIKRECDRRGWTLVATFKDSASDASLTKLEGLTAALGFIEARDAAGIVVAQLDRLSHSLSDFASLLRRAQAGEWNLVALDLGIDLSTAAGRTIANAMASAAEWERRVISERTRGALAVRRAHGGSLGRPKALGAAVVARITAAHAAGIGWSAIARDLNSDGVVTAHGGARWYPSTVRAVVLSNTEEAA